jgi:8-oxo-dGTP pyrophosphatase MutT (NUDIX family)
MVRRLPLPDHRMTLAVRLRRALGALDGDIHDDDRGPDPASLREAAVLIAVTDRPEPGVILTQRPQWLRSHGGQVAFPGGKIEAHDSDAVAAALREAQEEIGLNPRDVDVAGVGDAYHSGSGYRIVPVVAVIPPDLTFDPDPNEVEDWFEVPFDHLFNPANFAFHQAHWQGRLRGYYDMMWGERRIWGVTAGIIVNLAQRLPAGWRA